MSEAADPKPSVAALQGRSIVLAGILLLLLLGVVYAWSVFTGPLEKDFGWNRSQTSLAFSICMSMFCIGGLFSGLLQKKFPPRLAVVGCALALGAGFCLASTATSLMGLYASYGLLVGFGVGLAYNATLSTVLRWFPGQMGFISGLLMMAFGFGGMLLGAVGSLCIASIGWRSTFMGIGIVFPLLILLCSIKMVPPPAGYAAGPPPGQSGAKPAGKEMATGEMLRRASFWLFFVWSSILTAAGLMLIAHAVPFMTGMGMSAEKAALLAGVVSVCNGFGRVILGTMFDKIGRALVMLIVGLGFIVAGGVLYMSLQMQSVWVAGAGFALAGLSFGGVLPLNAVFIRSFFGGEHYPMNFSMVNMVLIVASFLGPYMAGMLHGISGTYIPMTLFMVLFGAFGILLTLFLNRSKDALEYKI